MTELRPSIFKQYAKNLLLIDAKNQSPALKLHPQVPFIIDTLSRQKHHPMLVSKCTSELIQEALMDALAHAFLKGELPKNGRDVFFIYFDILQFSFSQIESKQVEQDFQNLFEEIRSKNKRMIFVINQVTPFLENQTNPLIEIIGKLLKTIFFNHQWRLLILIKNHATVLPDLFTHLEFIPPKESEFLAILKTKRTEFENNYQLMLAEETMPAALSLASYYLPHTSVLDKAYELLDTAAAFAARDENHPKPIVTSKNLIPIISHWTEIPAPYLQNNQFKTTKFITSLQQTIIGHDSALHTIGELLQTSCMKLHFKPGVLCSFLFAGPKGMGKTTLSYAIAEHLFGHKNALLKVCKAQKPAHLSQMKVMIGADENRRVSLLSAIQQIPYAVLLIENIETYSLEIIDMFKEILALGYFYDSENNKYDFKNTIMIMTTNIHAVLHDLTKRQNKQKPVDLMQLVMNDILITHPEHHLSEKEIQDDLMQALTQHFSLEFLQYLNIIPIQMLDFSAYEKIIAEKLKHLGSYLDRHFGLELNYAPEVIQFLAHSALKQNVADSLNQVLEQHLYSCISHEMIAHEEDKLKSKRLLLQLNEAGHHLRCEFLFASEVNLHQLSF